jgi:hypothetical protein
LLSVALGYGEQRHLCGDQVGGQQCRYVTRAAVGQHFHCVETGEIQILKTLHELHGFHTVDIARGGRRKKVYIPVNFGCYLRPLSFAGIQGFLFVWRMPVPTETLKGSDLHPSLSGTVNPNVA